MANSMTDVDREAQDIATPMSKSLATTLEELVVEDPYILSGTPVIRGTRVPVHDVAAQLASGVPMDRILDTYPSLTARQVELAAVYAAATPSHVSPRRLVPPAGSKLIASRKYSRSSDNSQ